MPHGCMVVDLLSDRIVALELGGEGEPSYDTHASTKHIFTLHVRFQCILAWGGAHTLVA